MYTIYDNIIQKNQFSTTTNNVKVIQSSHISSKLFQVNNLQKMHDDHFVEGKTVEHQACYLSPGLLSGDHTQCQQKDYQLQKDKKGNASYNHVQALHSSRKHIITVFFSHNMEQLKFLARRDKGSNRL